MIQGAPTVHSSAVFRQSNEFFYLSGVVAPQALLLMDGGTRRSVLYLPKQNAGRAATEGDLLSSDDPAATVAITGVEEVKPPDMLVADLQARSRAKSFYVPFRAVGKREREPGRRAPTHAGCRRGSVGRPHQPRSASTRAADEAGTGARAERSLADPERDARHQERR